MTTHEPCDACGGAQYIEVLTTAQQSRETDRGPMHGVYAVRAHYPCGRCWGTGLIEVTA